jgi:MFS family permease
MSTTTNQKLVFWGCFIALVTTSFAFISRAFLVNDPNLWPAEFGLDPVQAQVLFGHGIWPFAISIILFSLFIDKIGYRTAMFFSFACYVLYAVFALIAYRTVNPAGEALAGEELRAAQASALNYLTIGSIILGLGNGTVEAFINPVVATLFSKEKTKWLNILHAGWPGGLVFGGILTILLGAQAAEDWRILVYILAIPAVIYLIMLVRARFPVNERVASGVSYREMLAEFGALGALIAAILVFMQIGQVAPAFGINLPGWLIWALIIVSVVAYGLYCRSLGRPMMILLVLIMMPLATTELGTDAAITGIMEEPLQAAGYNPLWVLIYTSLIMMVLRFFAGAIVHRINPIGLLIVCSVLAILGLFALSAAQGMVIIFAAATLYGVGKTFFWPTMLGVVAEQYPKGGAVTLNSIAGIGMLTVGIIGGPLIGAMQASSAEKSIRSEMNGIYEQVSAENTYFLGSYTAVDESKVATLPEEQQAEVKEITKSARQRALAKVTIFPIIMLLVYIGLFIYFRARGGYKPQELGEVLTTHVSEA